MMNIPEQKELDKKLQEAPEQLREKAIRAIGSFARGYLSGYEAAKAEKESQPA